MKYPHVMQALLVAADGAGPHSDYPHALLGDALVLGGASLYACCNVGQEVLLGALLSRP